MNATMFLAQMFGVLMTVAGVSVLLYPDRFSRAIGEVRKSYIVPYIDAMAGLLIGLAVVLVHNKWETMPQAVVSAAGWLALAEGILMYLLPHQSFVGIIDNLKSKQARIGIGILGVIVGGYLMYVGFFA